MTEAGQLGNGVGRLASQLEGNDGAIDNEAGNGRRADSEAADQGAAAAAGGGGGGGIKGKNNIVERQQNGKGGSPQALERDKSVRERERFPVGSACSSERERLKTERFSGPDRPFSGPGGGVKDKLKLQKFSGPDRLVNQMDRASARSPCGASRSPSVGSNYSSSSLQSNSEALQRSPWQQENMKHCLIDPRQLVIGEQFAAGPQATMHKGVFCKLEMAIKIIKPPEGAEEIEKLEQSFTEEVTMSLRLRHRNVIQFVGACRRPPLWAIVTEYLDGITLYEFIHEPKETPLDLRTILNKGLDIARGMEYLHSKQLVHRALRPQSLVMDSDGVVKVTEFGALRMQGDPDCSVGKEDLDDDDYRWMAPELIGHRPYDHKVDVYSFGIILWELMTGLVPFDGMPTVQAAVSIVNKHTRPELPDSCPAGLKAVIMECWSPDAENRPEFSHIVTVLENELALLKVPPLSTQKSGKSTWSWLTCCLAPPETKE